MKETTSQVLVFCTYKNKNTDWKWVKSRQYNSVEALLKAMVPYLQKNPRTLVQYQTCQVTSFGGQ